MVLVNIMTSVTRILIICVGNGKHCCDQYYFQEAEVGTNLKLEYI